MGENANSGYGAGKLRALSQFTTGKTFLVVGASSANLGGIQSLFKNDYDGVSRVYNDFTTALAACVSGRGDVIVVAPDFQTGPTAAELLSAESKGVAIIPAGQNRNGRYFAQRATAALPQTATGNLFAVTAKIRLLSIVGTVTTAIQAQANNAKLRAVPTVGSAVDLCAVADTNGLTVGTVLNITGTLATALQTNANGVLTYQTTPLIIPAGFVSLNTAASNTGAIKWIMEYEPLEQGGFAYAV